MEVKKFKEFYITDEIPSEGDRLICVNKKSLAYGLLSNKFKNGSADCLGTREKIVPKLVELGIWKVCITPAIAAQVNSLIKEAKRVQKEFEKTEQFWDLKNCIESVASQQWEPNYTERVVNIALSLTKGK